MVHAVIDLLGALGIESGQKDLALLNWALDEAENYAKYELNIFGDTLHELEAPLASLSAGEYLKAKRALEPEAFENLDLTPAIKRIEVGDTNTEFVSDSVQSAEQRFDLLTEYLIKSGKSKLQGYRRLKW